MKGAFDPTEILQIIEAFFQAILTVLKAIGIDFSKPEDNKDNKTDEEANA